MKTVFVTGISGYIGKSFVKSSKGEFGVISLDLKRDKELTDIEFFKEDVRSKNTKEILYKVKPYALLHLAFILNPPEDREVARSVNVEGTKNILEGALEAGVKHVVILSSSTSYGAHPDNPVSLKEDSLLRGDLNKGFWYSEDKVSQEKIAQEFAKENPEIKVAVARPCIVLGENVENFISQSVFKPPVLFITERDVPFQFIHEEDVAVAISKIIEREVSGVFNLAGNGQICLSEMARIMNKKTIKIPNSEVVQRLFLWFLKKARMFDKNLPLAFIDFFSYPWIVDTKKAQEELGFIPKYTSEEAFKRAYEAWSQKGKIC